MNKKHVGIQNLVFSVQMMLIHFYGAKCIQKLREMDSVSHNPVCSLGKQKSKLHCTPVTLLTGLT